jgi:hypothetical protein
MAHRDSLALTVATVIDAVERDIEGDVVECGTWLGGVSFACLLAQRYAFDRVVKPVWMFDSFAGLPAAEARDGPAAAAWQNDTGSATYYDNCTASLQSVKAVAAEFGFSESEALIVPGWFDQTLPAFNQALSARKIATLRIDCDWYAPVRCVLDHLAGLVIDEGRIIIDDYFAWDGCARAVHDYLSSNDLPWRIRSIGHGDDVGAWMIKRTHRAPDQSS